MRRDFTSLSRQTFDLLVIGGGITGSCIARDAAMRGLKVALVEKGDFSHATSAHNSRLVHGGLRYLKNFELGLVRESLRERRIWQRIAPHLVYPLPFLVPQKGGWFSGLVLRAGLMLYDLLSFDRGWLADKDQRLPGHRRIGKADLEKRAPVMTTSGYSFAYEYHDCQMDAPERLGLGCLADAATRGAAIVNYAEAFALMQDDAKTVSGARIRCALTGAEAVVKARLTVNAAGPWADGVMALAHPAQPPFRLARARGIHVITRPLSARDAFTVFIGKKHFFVMPWRGCSLIGTTDDADDRSPDAVTASADDIAALLALVNEGLPEAKLTPSDVIHAYAGVRPLVEHGAPSGGSYNLSRKSEVLDHARDGIGGLMSALGGKWTTSRHQAAEAVDMADRKLGRTAQRAPTDKRPLGGASVGNFTSFVARLTAQHRHVQPRLVNHLARLYGVEADDVIALAEGRADLLRPFSEQVPDCPAQVLYAMRREMAVTLEDVIFRRTGLGLTGYPGGDVIAAVAAVMQAEKKWSAEECARQISGVRAAFQWPAP